MTINNIRHVEVADQRGSCCLPVRRFWHTVRGRDEARGVAVRVHPYTPAAEPHSSTLPGISRTTPADLVCVAGAASSSPASGPTRSPVPSKPAVRVTSASADPSSIAVSAARGGAGGGSATVATRSALVFADVVRGPHYSLQLAARAIATTPRSLTLSKDLAALYRAVDVAVRTSPFDVVRYGSLGERFAQFGIVGAATVEERTSRLARTIFIKRKYESWTTSFTAHTALMGDAIGNMEVYCGREEMSVHSLNSTAKTRFKGVGTVLIQVAIETALRLGYEKPPVLQSMTTALAFYSKLGFKVDSFIPGGAATAEELDERISRTIEETPKGEEPKTGSLYHRLTAPMYLPPEAFTKWKVRIEKVPVLFP